MKRQLLWLLSAFLCVFIFQTRAHAQFNINTNPYWEGEITLLDGTVKKGMVKVPNNPKENYIAFKPSETGEKETVRRKEIKSVAVVSPTGNPYYYEHVPVVLVFKGDKPYGSSLLLTYKRNDYAKFYVESGVYRVDEKAGTIYTLYRYNQGKDLPTVQYYIQKRGKDHANILCMTGAGMIGLNSKLRKSAERNLTEDPALLKRIMNKDLDNRDIHEIIDTYLASTTAL